MCEIVSWYQESEVASRGQFGPLDTETCFFFSIPPTVGACDDFQCQAIANICIKNEGLPNFCPATYLRLIKSELQCVIVFTGGLRIKLAAFAFPPSTSNIPASLCRLLLCEHSLRTQGQKYLCSNLSCVCGRKSDQGQILRDERGLIPSAQMKKMPVLLETHTESCFFPDFIRNDGIS